MAPETSRPVFARSEWSANSPFSRSRHARISPSVATRASLSGGNSGGIRQVIIEIEMVASIVLGIVAAHRTSMSRRMSAILNDAEFGGAVLND
jgi:hypothetical protein